MNTTMDEYVAEFSIHLRQALDIAAEVKLDTYSNFNKVLICGLGGSGIGGTILGQLLADHCPVPILTSKDYDIPAYVDNKTLVITCSYSGNTEETLEAAQLADERGAQVACISSGGKLSDLAITREWLLVNVPGGMPPRAAFGFSLVQLFRIAELYGLTGAEWKDQVTDSITYLDAHEEAIRISARQLAESIQHKLPVIYSSAWLEGVAIRWRQQINENSKALGWHNVYPEMNHNELVGWASGNHDLGVIYLTSSFDHPRVTRRMELTEMIYKKKTPHIHHYGGQGKTKLEQTLYLIHLGDWMSVYMAMFKGEDPVEIEVINWLKGELENF